MTPVIAGLISAGLSAGSSVVGNIINKDISDRNLAYQKEYNDAIMRREDTAVARRAADLQSVGLSQTLAAGNGAGAGGQAVAPQSRFKAELENLDVIRGYLGAIQQRQDIAHTAAGTAVAEAERINREADTANKLITARMLSEQVKGVGIENAKNQLALDIIQRDLGLTPAHIRYKDDYGSLQKLGVYGLNRVLSWLGLNQDDEGVSKTFSDATSKAGDAIKYVKDSAVSLYNKITKPIFKSTPSGGGGGGAW